VPVWRPAPDQPRPRPATRTLPPATRTLRPAARALRPAAGPSIGSTVLSGKLPDWQLKLALMAACTIPGMLARLAGGLLPPQLGIFIFGGGVMAAAFMLGSAAEAAEIDVPPGLAVAGVAFVAVLPEFVIEVYFAFTGHVEFVTASLTGSTRLLLGFAVGMPALASLVLRRRGRPRVETVEISRRRRIDLAVIAAASLYAPFIVLRGHLAVSDSLVLLGLYVAYMRRASSGDPEPPHLVGISAALGDLPKHERKRWVIGIIGFSATAVLASAEPFANSVLLSGTAVGISPYLLVQWLVPLATEMPELVIAFVLVTHERAGQAVAVLLSSAVSQWTFALGTLPLAYKAGVGVGPLPLLGREQIELLLTMGQGLLAVAMLVTLRLDRRNATLMLVLFFLQLITPSLVLRAAATLGYLVLAVDLFSSERWAIPTLVRALRRGEVSAEG
jgi:cation:H+ antiporter